MPNSTGRAETGTKRGLLTDGGVPVGVAVAGANRPAYQLTEATLKDLDTHLPQRPQPTEAVPQGMSLNQGGNYQKIHELLDTWGFSAHIRPLAAVKRQR